MQVPVCASSHHSAAPSAYDTGRLRAARELVAALGRRAARFGAIALVFAVLGLAPGLAHAASIRLAWDANTEADLAGYAVSYRSDNGQHTGTVSVGKVTEATISGLEPGQTYTLSVVALNTIGMSSGPSNEVTGVANGPDVAPPTGGGGTQTYFAEGAAGVFSYRLALLNTTSSAADVTVTFLREGNTPVQRTYPLAALSRGTISAADIPELQGTSFGTIVSSSPGVIAERTMGWNAGGTMAGAHTAKAISTPSTTWYLAEGNAGFFDTFVLLANAQATATNVTVDFLLDDGTVVSRPYALGPFERRTIYTNEIPELVPKSFATAVRADQGILVERAMYFKDGSPMFRGGASSAGVPSGSTHWFLAEGQTGDFFETFLLLGNPNSSPAEVTVRYLTNAGVARVETLHMAPTSRTTVVVDSLPELAATDVSFDVSSTVPIVAERSMYWPGAPGPWYGAHNSVGLTDLGTEWALAEGEVGGALGAESFILLANPGSAPSDVTLTFYREGGRAPLTLQRSVAAGTRLTVTSSEAGFESGERFGAIITSSQPIAVERSMYWQEGAPLGSGTNETGTRLK
jgi:hypothetical protein